ncbi:flagellar export protein FliJ [Roseixanthobacter pseudopolyaromaticivorans]|uniref:flagellar export protein FliJ n=1 Tax=Xanthobacteraceae TaxID=335928 RepID=UPI003728AE75
MKSREPLIRAKRFKIEDARRRIVRIDTMIAEFDRMAADLDRDIAGEEERSGISDPRHFAYSPLAAAARQRRDNLSRSAQDLRTQRDEAESALADAEAQLQMEEAASERERVSEAEALERRIGWRMGEPARA